MSRIAKPTSKALTTIFIIVKYHHMHQAYSIKAVRIQCLHD